MARLKNKDDQMDFLIYAIKRMAAAQEESNKLALQIIEQNRKSYELNSKQYTLNIDNYKRSLESDDMAAQYKAGVEEAMDSAKKYIDEHVLEIQKVLGSHKRSLTNINIELYSKAGQEEVAKSLSKKILAKFKGKGLI